MNFALAGNPNSGKTTLFNTLTGATAHVGNWPGVTIDKKEGLYKKLSETVNIIDLPGIYSLSPYSPEEIVTREYLINSKPDCIINIVDATNLERSLYLTTQLMETDIPIVVALNMSDALESSGGSIDIEKLSSALGLKAVAVSALKNHNIGELMETCYHEAKHKRKGTSVLKHNPVLKNLYSDVEKLYEAGGMDFSAFHIVKMIEGDEPETARCPEIAKETAALKNRFLMPSKDTFEGLIADERYRYIADNYISALKRGGKDGQTKSDRIDKVLTHRIFGIPLFFLIMFSVFHLTFSENFLFLGLFIPKGTFDNIIFGTDAINSPGVILFNCMDWLTSTALEAVAGAMPKGTWYTSLVCDGLLSGVFAVLSFIPQIMCLFLFISILEDSGYMSRVAFIMDRAFKGFGLSGKAFMPLIMCFGCAVPGIMATRTLENPEERRRTVFLTPFFSCGAKLPVWAAFSAVFAQNYMQLNAEVVVYSMYVLGILIAVVASLILKSTIIKGETAPFIMELPDYRLPQLKNVAVYLWQKLKHYIFRAATVVAGAVVVIWFLSNFSFSFQMVDSGDSMLGVIGKFITPLFIPLGFGMGENGWMFVVAAITGFAAKEIVVATLGTFAGAGLEGGLSSETAFQSLLLGIGGMLGGIDIAVPAMFAFMAFNLLSVPCIAAVGAAGAELNGKKWLLIAIGFWIVVSYTVSLVIFWFGTLIIVCWWAALIAGVAFIILTAALIALRHKSVKKKKSLQAVKI